MEYLAIGSVRFNTFGWKKPSCDERQEKGWRVWTTYIGHESLEPHILGEDQLVQEYGRAIRFFQGMPLEYLYAGNVLSSLLAKVRQGMPKKTHEKGVPRS